MKIRYSRYVLLALIIVSFEIDVLHSQENKRANVWYFGDKAGVDFNAGEPNVLYNGMAGAGVSRGCVTMSDTNGQLLFYTNGNFWYGKDHTYLGFVPGTVPSSYDVISFPMPGSQTKYYVFSVPNLYPPISYNYTWYTIFDTEQNGGLGDMSEGVFIDMAWDADEKICAVKHKNNADYWVVLRKLEESQYASFLVTEEGVGTDPVMSLAPYKEPYVANSCYEFAGQLKISYDKKYLLNTYRGGSDPLDNNDLIEVCGFNAETGEVNYLYSFQLRDPDVTNYDYSTFGVEFSPCSKLLYISCWETVNTRSYIYQFDMENIEDSGVFINSKVLVGTGSDEMDGLQLATDGKIYITGKRHPDYRTYYLGCIHNPSENGIACNFEYANELTYLYPNYGQGKLPNILPDYLYRFVWDGTCETDTFYFEPLVPANTYSHRMGFR